MSVASAALARSCAPTLAAAAAALPPAGEQFAPWGGPAARWCAPTLAAIAAALPPEGEQFAPWGGPAARWWAPTLAAIAAALPPEGEQFAPWGGPAALMPISALVPIALRNGDELVERGGERVGNVGIEVPTAVGDDDRPCLVEGHCGLVD